MSLNALRFASAVATVVICLAVTGPALASTLRQTVHSIPVGPLPEQNPLKGLIAYSDAYSFPHSMDWFYLPVNSVQKGPDTFDWSALEAQLNAVAARGDQACFRFYYDYPAQPNGIPAYLLASGREQLKTTAYTDYGGGECPDYNSDAPGSRRFRASMQKFIAAFGAKYDGDPRIGYITVGLLGFWGEWHTYPHVDWTPSDSTMNLVLDSYVKAFHKTRLLVRYPAASAPTLPIGYHDDAFCYETLYRHDWEFAARLKTAKVSDIWQTQPIGGEIMPDVQGEVFSRSGDAQLEPWSDCAAAVHPTWMLDDKIKSYTGAECDAAIRASSEMGYNFRVKTATYGDIPRSRPLRFGVHIDNIGIAPFYYRWKVLAGVLKNGRLVKSWSTGWDITRIAAGSGVDYAFAAAKPGLAPGTYTLAIRVVNPLRTGKPLLFANAGQSPNGWLSLKSIKVD